MNWFECPDCGSYHLEEVRVGVVEYVAVTAIVVEQGSTTCQYGPGAKISGAADHYRCGKCLHVLSLEEQAALSLPILKPMIPVNRAPDVETPKEPAQVEAKDTIMVVVNHLGDQVGHYTNPGRVLVKGDYVQWDPDFSTAMEVLAVTMAELYYGIEYTVRCGKPKKMK